MGWGVSTAYLVDLFTSNVVKFRKLWAFPRFLMQKPSPCCEDHLSKLRAADVVVEMVNPCLGYLCRLTALSQGSKQLVLEQRVDRMQGSELRI